MTVRPWLVALVSVSALAAWTNAAPAGPARYRVEVKTAVTQDLTAVGQGEQKQEFTNTGFVTVTTKDSAGGQALTIVLDSLLPGEGSPFAGEMAKGAAGTTWTGFRQPNGVRAGRSAGRASRARPGGASSPRAARMRPRPSCRAPSSGTP